MSCKTHPVQNCGSREWKLSAVKITMNTLHMMLFQLKPNGQLQNRNVSAMCNIHISNQKLINAIANMGTIMTLNLMHVSMIKKQLIMESISKFILFYREYHVPNYSNGYLTNSKYNSKMPNEYYNQRNDMSRAYNELNY